MLKRLRLIPLLFLVTLTSAAPMVTACSDSTGSCCKVCHEGKPCGDTCIAKNLTCHKAGGCACQV